MTMDDDFIEATFVFKKLISNRPEQIWFALLAERNTWSHPCMDEQKISAAEPRNELIDKPVMICCEFGWLLGTRSCFSAANAFIPKSRRNHIRGTIDVA